MLEEVRIDDVATYRGLPQTLGGLRPVNFVFGTNGSGKTTISRVIANPEAFPSCGVTWRKAQALQQLVYNSDFATQNYVARLKGIFTLGDTTAKALADVEAARKKVEDLGGDIATLQERLGPEDEGGGCRAERAALRAKFEVECWTIKAKHDADFAGAFEGVRTSKVKFCDRVILEAANRATPLLDVEALKTRATVVFAEGAVSMVPLAEIDADPLVALEADPVLVKRVVGKQDIDVAGLIKRLGNSDWVRQGLNFAEADAPCPFCQKPLEDVLYRQLTDFFDEAYDADIASIGRLEAAYRDTGDRILATAETALASRNRYIEGDGLRLLVDRLAAQIALNNRLIEGKRKEPSTPVALEPVSEALEAVRTAIAAANAEIATHNALVANLKAERTTLTSQIWRRLTEDRKATIDAYSTGKGRLDNTIASMATVSKSQPCSAPTPYW